MNKILYSVWLQANVAKTDLTNEHSVAELEAHYLIPAFFLILIIAVVAGIAITVQKHRQS